MDLKFCSEKYRIMKCISGSRAYGLDTPESDIDYRGVFMVPREFLYSPFYKIEQIQKHSEEDDIQYYSIDKLFKLLGDNNPNIIELLYMPKDNLIETHPIWDMIVNNRDMFLHKGAYYRFSGYAHAQLKRIKGHNKYISNPMPKTKPVAIDFFEAHGIKNNKYITPKDYKEEFEYWQHVMGAKPLKENIFLIYKNGKGLFNKEGNLLSNYENNYDKSSEIVGIGIFKKEEYKQQLHKWKDYWNWVKNRNVKRNDLEQKYGYDTKHGSHLARLLLMCKYILKEHNVYVRLPEKDLDFVRKIKFGKVSYDNLIKWAEDMDILNKKLYDVSTLQSRPNLKKINDLYMHINSVFWN